MPSLFTEILAPAITAVSILSFTVMVIVEVIKDVKPFKGVPTDIIVIILSVLLTSIVYFAYCDIVSIKVVWYGVTGAFFSGFFVAFVSMYGWDKFNALYSRYKIRKGKSKKAK